MIIGHMVGPGQNGGVRNAVNPAWKTGILLPLTNRLVTTNTTLESAIVDQIPLDNALKAASPGSGTYLNEVRTLLICLSQSESAQIGKCL